MPANGTGKSNNLACQHHLQDLILGPSCSLEVSEIVMIECRNPEEIDEVILSGSSNCYVGRCCLSCALLLDLSRGSASCILLFIVCTVIHNCLSLGSFSSQHLCNRVDLKPSQSPLSLYKI